VVVSLLVKEIRHVAINYRGVREEVILLFVREMGGNAAFYLCN